jgi:hypothetical protein
MSKESDPNSLVEALEAAIDTFNEEGRGIPEYERGIDSDEDWKTQLTKSCKLLHAVALLNGEGYHTATIELCFGAIERSIEAFALAEGGDELRDFQDHEHSYDRAAELALLSETTIDDLKMLYGNNRTDSYYGGKQPTLEQAEALHLLASEIHDHSKNQIREGGVCLCE